MDFCIGKVYDFSTIATGVFGAKYTNMRLSGIIDFDTAKSTASYDISTTHARITLLYTGTLPSYDKCNWCKFKSLDNDNTLVIAREYIAVLTEHVDTNTNMLSVSYPADMNVADVIAILKEHGVDAVVG